MVEISASNPMFKSYLTGKPTAIIPDNMMNNNQANEQENSISRNENEVNNEIIIENTIQGTSCETLTSKWQNVKNTKNPNMKGRSVNQRQQRLDAFNLLFGPKPYYEKFYVMKFPGIKIDKDLNMRGAWEDLQNQIGGKPHKVTRNGYESLLIETESKNQSEKLKNLKELNGNKIQVIPHHQFNTVKGVLRSVAFANATEEEKKNIMQEFDIIHQIRMQRKENGTWKNTNTFIVTFERTELPEYINVVPWIKDKIEKYNERPMRCSYCQKFGHKAKKCSSKLKICPRCSMAAHENSPCEDPIRCYNCAGDHHAYSTTCPKYLIEEEILKTASTEKIPHSVARQKVLERNPEHRKLYDRDEHRKRNPITYEQSRTLSSHENENSQKKPEEMITDETEATNNNQLQTPHEVNNQFKDLSWSDATHDNQGFWSAAEDVNLVSTTTQKDLTSTPVDNPKSQRDKQKSSNSTKLPQPGKTTRTSDIEPKIVKEHDSNSTKLPLPGKKTRTIDIEPQIVKEHDSNAEQNPNQTNLKNESIAVVTKATYAQSLVQPPKNKNEQSKNQHSSSNLIVLNQPENDKVKSYNSYHRENKRYTPEQLAFQQDIRKRERVHSLSPETPQNKRSSNNNKNSRYRFPSNGSQDRK